MVNAISRWLGRGRFPRDSIYTYFEYRVGIGTNFGFGQKLITYFLSCFFFPQSFALLLEIGYDPLY
jgi:hypothetical protein